MIILAISIIVVVVIIIIIIIIIVKTLIFVAHFATESELLALKFINKIT